MYIEEAILDGFDVEIDIRVIDGKVWAGHDHAEYLIHEDFLAKYREKLWIHCKNLDALNYFTSKLLPYKYFYHNEDKYTLTSNGFIWTYPGGKVGPWSIIVDLDKNITSGAYGTCNDYVALV